MLLSCNDLMTFVIRAADGRTGGVDDIYFDDSSWTVRYLVAHTGFFLTGHQGLVGTALLGAPDLVKQEFPVELTKEELKSTPSPETDVPVGDQEARAAYPPDDTLWPPILAGTGVPFSPGLAMEHLGFEQMPDAKQREKGARGDPHLRSLAEVSTYAVEAKDGEFGSASDFLINPDTWTVQFVVVDTGKWLPGRRFAVTTEWISEIDWPAGKIHADVDRKQIEDAPRLRDVEDLKLSDQKMMTERYGAVGYWPI